MCTGHSALTLPSLNLCCFVCCFGLFLSGEFSRRNSRTHPVRGSPAAPECCFKHSAGHGCTTAKDRRKGVHISDSGSCGREHMEPRRNLLPQLLHIKADIGKHKYLQSQGYPGGSLVRLLQTQKSIKPVIVAWHMNLQDRYTTNCSRSPKAISSTASWTTYCNPKRETLSHGFRVEVDTQIS